jgi:hypothetical protein
VYCWGPTLPPPPRLSSSWKTSCWLAWPVFRFGDQAAGVTRADRFSVRVLIYSRSNKNCMVWIISVSIISWRQLWFMLTQIKIGEI